MSEELEKNQEVGSATPPPEVKLEQDQANEETAQEADASTAGENETATATSGGIGFDAWFKRSFQSTPLDTAKKLIETYKNSGSSFGYLCTLDLAKTLTDTQLLQVIDAIDEWEEIQRLQNQILQETEAQGKLTDELRQTILKTYSLNVLEDIFLPYKMKKKTLAAQAREAGMGEAADYIWNKGHDLPAGDKEFASLDELYAAYQKADTPYATPDSVQKAILNILTEKLAETPELRSAVRRAVFRQSKLRTVKGPKAKEKSRYSRYFNYREPIGSLKKPAAAARYLMLRKGWLEDELVLSFERPGDDSLKTLFETHACSNAESIGAEILKKAANTALNTNVFTAIENEASRLLKKSAETNLLYSLALSLKKKLMEAPFGNKAVMGVDHTGSKPSCHIALINESGVFIGGTKFDLQKIAEDETIKKEIIDTLEKIKLDAIAVNHGPLAKKIRSTLSALLSERGLTVPVHIVYDKNSSIYASSAAGKEELSDQTNNIRKAAFVALHFQDPLKALVKLDPKYLNFGQYQYDLNHNRLEKVFRRVIELAVARVGVHLPTASQYELNYVPGLNATVSKEVRKLCLEKKEAIKADDLAVITGLSADNLNLAKAVFTERTESDARGSFTPFEYDAEVKDLESLAKDRKFRGVVTNITNFGAFVDIGLDTDGLIPITETAQLEANEGAEPISIGDSVEVWVNTIDLTKKQLSFTFLSPEERAERRQKFQRKAKSDRGGSRPPRGKGRPRRAGSPGKNTEADSNGSQRKDGDKGGERKFRGKGPRDNSDGRKKDSKPKRERRDPKTGAIIRGDDGAWGKKTPRGKFKTKAKTATFNPFAALGEIMKDSDDKPDTDK